MLDMQSTELHSGWCLTNRLHVSTVQREEFPDVSPSVTAA